MTKLDRRQTLIGMATLIGTTLLIPSALAQKSGAVRLIVERPESPKGREGPALREALLKLGRPVFPD